MTIKIGLILVIMIIMVLLLNLRKLKQPYNNSFFQVTILHMIVIFFIIAMFGKPIFKNSSLNENCNDYIYNKYFVDALIQGNLSIDLKPPKELEDLDNPYDIKQREDANISYSFDTVYYNGKYYVYFGAVPAVLLFVPYKLITGQYLSIEIGTMIFVVLSIIINIKLTIEIYKRWFKDIPFGLLLIFIIGNLISGLYIWNTWRIWAYELTIIAGLFFVQLGIFLILKATDDKDNKTKNLIYLFLSCLSMALSVGCRPILVLASALLIPFLYDLLKR